MEKKFNLILILMCIVLFTSCKDQSTSTNVEKIIDSKDFTDSVFTAGIEGPSFYNGHIYLVNHLHEGTIGKVDLNGQVQNYITLENNSVANGIVFDTLGNMYLADYVNHNVLKVNSSKVVSVFAHDSSLNQPNDLAIAPNQLIYCSDPNWKESTGNIWLVKDGVFVLLEDSMGTTNGIEVSNDGKYLFVNESVQKNVWRYDIATDGFLSNKKLIHHFENDGMDGMRMDKKFQLWIARYDHQSVVVMDTIGNIIKEFYLKGKKPTNVCILDDKCFVTLQDRGRMEVISIPEELR